LVKSLLIENSTESGSVAVADEGEVLIRREFSKSGKLSLAVQELFQESGAPDEIIVGIGPGSYTGMRVAAATAIGLQLALGCPAFGCPSVLGYEAVSYHVVGDARLNSVFLASIENKRLIRNPELLSIEEFQSMLPTLGDRPIFSIGPVPSHGYLPVLRPRAEYLLRCRDSFRPAVEPIYLKEPHVTVRGQGGRGEK
jgi:tRNA A37 threonylcarbamoyladenosine modification protein TsaB